MILQTAVRAPISSTPCIISHTIAAGHFKSYSALNYSNALKFISSLASPGEHNSIPVVNNTVTQRKVHQRHDPPSSRSSPGEHRRQLAGCDSRTYKAEFRRYFCSRPPSGEEPVEYKQGQSPGPKLREYFYYIDHQGMLFLDDSRMKNFTSCFKEKKFLEFFFRRLRRNDGERYHQFPYVSLCGREMNYVRCDDLPIVYTQLIPPDDHNKNNEEESIKGGGGGYLLRYNHGDDTMMAEFEPSKVLMEPESGRLYHPAPPKLASKAAPVALLHTKLALHLASNFSFSDGDDSPPSHLRWQEEDVPLDNHLLQQLRQMADIRRYSLGLQHPQ